MWPPAALVLAVWMVRAARRATTGRSRWLLYPVIGLVAVTAVGGAVESVTLARDHGRYPMTGALYDVGGHRLHLNCTGTGSPTVVLENGLNEISPLWSGITAQVSRTTRVCAYDRAGQGWSDDVAHPQDGVAVAADLHTLLARAGEHGPYVLAGHSSGGTLAMTYAARYPAQVAGMVLLDSSSPHQYTDQPDFAGTFAMMRRLLPVFPALGRVGALHLIPPSTATALSPEAAAEVQAFATSPRGANNMRDEQAQLLAVFPQAQALTSFDPKPLAVVTARENADGTKGWAAAQDRMAALSTNSTHWTADTTHVGLLDDADGVDRLGPRHHRRRHRGPHRHPPGHPMSRADRPDAAPRPETAMTPTPTDLGTHAWVTRTGGRLTAAERRSLLPAAGPHACGQRGRPALDAAAGQLRPPGRSPPASAHCRTRS